VGWAKELTSTVPSGAQQGAYETAMLDGRDSLHSTSIQGPDCWQRTDAHGQVHRRHTVVSATVVKAGSHRVLPLDVEEGRNSDGQTKHDCEVHAAKRLLPRLRQSHPQRPLMVGGDALYGHEPFIAQVRALRLHDVLVCQPTSHPALSEWVKER